MFAPCEVTAGANKCLLATTWDMHQHSVMSNSGYMKAFFDNQHVTGTLWVWGTNVNGSLGINCGTVGFRVSSPVQIPGTNWTCIVAGLFGRQNVMGLKQDNTLWVWGGNSAGELGLNDVTPRSSPVQLPGTSWNDIQVGGQNMGGLKSDNTLWIWGPAGPIGRNDNIPYSSPVQVPGTSWASFSMGSNAVATKSDGTLWQWGGAGWQGFEMGDGSATPRSSPIQITGTDWGDVSGGSTVYGATFIARKRDGLGYAWARGDGYGIGVGDASPRSTPTLMANNPFFLNTRGFNRAGRQQAIAKPGGVWVGWGEASFNTFGPNPYPGLCVPSAIYESTCFLRISGGMRHAGWVFKNGTMKNAGANREGQFGVNSVSYAPGSPMQIPGNSWISLEQRPACAGPWDGISFARKSN